MSVLSIDDLHVTYRSRGEDIPAVRGVSLEVGRGQVLGVAGESGCGKSSLASTILRLQPRSAKVTGEVLLDGKDVLGMRWGELRAVRWSEAAIVFQGAQHSLNPVRRIGDQIAEPLLVHGTAKKEIRPRVVELLGQVGLPASRADAYPHQLSGGQRQRVMLAMALACRPSLIVADEPTTALDVMVQAQVLALLRRLVAELDMGMLLISHDLSMLASQCDRVAVMYAGRVIETAPAAQIFEHPDHPYTRALWRAFPTIGDQASRFAPAGLAGDPPDPRDLPPGCSFAPRCPAAVDRCLQVDPRLEPTGPDRAAACIRVGDLDLKESA